MCNNIFSDRDHVYYDDVLINCFCPQVAGLKKVEHANPEDLDEEFGGEDEEEDVIGGGQKDVRPQSVPEKSEQTLSLPSADFEAGTT